MSDEKGTPGAAMIPLDRAPFTFKTLQAIANTDFVPRELRGKPNSILACILMGRELGLGPMESMRSIDVIDGRPSPSAEWMTGRILEAGHTLEVVEQTDKKCTVVGQRYRDGEPHGKPMSFTFTWAMAERVKDRKGQALTAKTNYKHYPEAMLYWRAVAQLARQLFPDVLRGVKYTPDEIGVAEWDAGMSEQLPEEADLPEVETLDDDDTEEELEELEIVEDDEAPEAIREWRPEPSGEDDKVAIGRVLQYSDTADLWADLLNVLADYETWLKLTVPETQAEIRFMFRAMEALKVWQGDDVLHDELRRIGKAHLADLRKGELTSWARSMVTKATVATRNE